MARTRKPKEDTSFEQLAKKTKYVARTLNQEDYIRSIIENDITICHGSAGTGKSLLGINTACNQLVQGKIDQILITRPLIFSGQNVGIMPGDLQEKIDCHFAAQKDYLIDYFGVSEFKKLCEQEIIKLFPLELLRGTTYNNCIMIADEAQNSTITQMKLFLSRMGQNSKCIVTGDDRQIDIYKNNGLEFCAKNLDGIPGVGVIKMGYEDIQRSGILRYILEVFDKYEDGLDAYRKANFDTT